MNVPSAPVGDTKVTEDELSNIEYYVAVLSDVHEVFEADSGTLHAFASLTDVRAFSSGGSGRGSSIQGDVGRLESVLCRALETRACCTYVLSPSAQCFVSYFERAAAEVSEWEASRANDQRRTENNRAFSSYVSEQETPDVPLQYVRIYSSASAVCSLIIACRVPCVLCCCAACWSRSIQASAAACRCACASSPSCHHSCCW